MPVFPTIMKLFLLCSPALALTIDVPTKEIAPGVHMPVLSIGTGGLEIIEAQKIAENWLGLGGHGIDTAYIYHDQNVVKDAIASSGLARKDVFITTKIPGCFRSKDLIESDLKQLGTDYIDLLLIHFPMGDCTQAWQILEDYHKTGKAKAIGVSNFKKANLQPILEIASVVPHVNQIELNILEHDAETIAYSSANNITIEAYSPLGRSGHAGDVTGHPVVQAVAATHNVSSYQVALRWIVQHGYVLTFQSSSQVHQKVDADIFGFTLTEEEMAKLDGLPTSHGSAVVVV